MHHTLFAVVDSKFLFAMTALQTELRIGISDVSLKATQLDYLPTFAVVPKRRRLDERALHLPAGKNMCGNCYIQKHNPEFKCQKMVYPAQIQTKIPTKIHNAGLE